MATRIEYLDAVALQAFLRFAAEADLIAPFSYERLIAAMSRLTDERGRVPVSVQRVTQPA